MAKKRQEHLGSEDAGVETCGEQTGQKTGVGRSALASVLALVGESVGGAAFVGGV